MKEHLKRFLKQLLHWTIHCTICAAPSFAIAGFLLSFFDSVPKTLAMVFGVVLFILAYTTLSTFWKPLHDPKNLLSRALKIALKLRFAISLLSLLTLWFGHSFSTAEEGVYGFLRWIPDYWAGWLAYLILDHSFNFLGFADLEPISGTFGSTLTWTLLEGAILSLALFMLTFFSLLFLSFRQKRKWQKQIPEEDPSSQVTSS